MGKTKSIHSHIREHMMLAKVYAEDGALWSAARVLRGLAEDIEVHAERVNAWLTEVSSEHSDDPVNLAGSGPVPIEKRAKP